MEHKYFKVKKELALPSYDEAITKWLEFQPKTSPLIPYKILICNENVFYREITCDGLGEYVEACEFLRSLDLVDASEYDFGLRGYDSVFVSQRYIDKASSTHR